MKAIKIKSQYGHFLIDRRNIKKVTMQKINKYYYVNVITKDLISDIEMEYEAMFLTRFFANKYARKIQSKIIN